ncbi:hypothetical protein ACFXTO_024620 [Malus domestica]
MLLCIYKKKTKKTKQKKEKETYIFVCLGPATNQASFISQAQSDNQAAESSIHKPNPLNLQLASGLPSKTWVTAHSSSPSSLVAISNATPVQNPQAPQPTKGTKKVAVAASVEIVTFGMLSGLAFFLYHHRVKHPSESQKLIKWRRTRYTEMLTPINTECFEEEMGESSGSYIIRIPFGPKDKYIPNEELWPHIPEFVDGALNHIMQMSKVLGEQVGGGKPVWPVAIHGHYADAGDSAALFFGALNVPMLFTGHSLGRDKLEQLLKQGRLSRDEINKTYKIMRRIEAEELALDAFEIFITSTRQEIEEQWRLYDGFDPILERKLRARIRRNVSCYGRFMPRMVIIPPGMEFHHIVPHDGDMDAETEANEDHHTSPDPPIWSEIMRFFTNPRKPMILALARPDPKKNIITLLKAFGECHPLRELANLTLITGNRDGIDEMSSTSAYLLLSVLKLIDKYDLYGQVAHRH